ncbi:ER membrane protein SH3 [Coniosporium apollinis CBS 100218]|uniref:ER membrane protein SH3 n=1 Tax=Coniosporium apollinis (strain CBS 100218) TaxID=1168221 RepID=R7YT76_CONA1|nr:ER membrane protein SH3 [Coniosporium apollinis CBS 100218]EON65034.1 ER membrane protein SH3 [Coniosporium apollinis CBS 100218]
MPKPTARSSPFGTFLVVGPTCFFLGILFASFPYDYNVLWSTPPDREPYFQLLENHLKFLHASPPLIARILHIVIGTGLLGFVMKLYKPSEANMLFDGASLVLYMCGITVYIANIVKGLRLVTAGAYGPDQGLVGEVGQGGAVDVDSMDIVGREDSLRVLAASNTILALVLVGVLVLQAGEWYAQKKEEAEIAEMDRIAEEKRRGGKKKQ